MLVVNDHKKARVLHKKIGYSSYFVREFSRCESTGSLELSRTREMSSAAALERCKLQYGHKLRLSDANIPHTIKVYVLKCKAIRSKLDRKLVPNLYCSRARSR